MNFKLCYNLFTMKINERIRKKAIKRILHRLEVIRLNLSPYGYRDPLKYYYLTEYWEEKLNEL